MKTPFVSLAVLGAALGLVPNGPLVTPSFAALAEVTVKRQEPVVTRQLFDPKRPSPKMPKLTPPESGVCDFDFEIDTGVSYSMGAAGPGTLEITVDEIDIVTSLAVRIWTARGTPEKLLAHEEGHRRICEYYYQNADFIAREVAEPLIGRTYVGRGANRQAAQSDAVQQVLKTVSDAYMFQTRVRTSAAQRRYDRLTQHGLNRLGEDEAIASATREDPEPSRESRLAAAAATAAQASASAPAPAAAVEQFWKWNDLVNRPERWPLAAKLNRLVTFQGGKRFLKDTPVRVTKVAPREADVVLPDGTLAGFGPEDIDLVQAANAYWATLTPEQRAVNYAAIVRDVTLQPTSVITHVTLQFAKEAIAPGSEVPLVEIVNQRLHVWGAADGRPMAIEPTETDILARARALVAVPPLERPDRFEPLLRGRTLGLDGRKVDPDSGLYYVFYGASSTCGNSQAYTPRFAERMKRILAAHDNVRLVSLSNDATNDAMLAFARQHGLPGFFVPMSDRHPSLYRYHVSLMPGLTIVDRTGREVASLKRYAGPASLDRLLDALETELGQRSAAR